MLNGQCHNFHAMAFQKRKEKKKTFFWGTIFGSFFEGKKTFFETQDELHRIHK